MKTSLRLAVSILLTLSISAHLRAQGGNPQLERYSGGGVTFQYPSAWTLTDKSTSDNQHLVLEMKGTSAQIMVLVERVPSTQPGQRGAALRARTTKFADLMTDELKKTGSDVQRSETLTEAGGVQAEGIRLRAAPGGQPGSIEVYSFVLGGRIVMLTLLRPDTDASVATPAWAAVRSSLRVTESTASAPAAPAVQRSARFAGFDYGNVSGSSYTNSFFGFRLTIPYGWRVQGQEVKDMLSEKGRDSIQTDARTKAQLDASTSNTVNMLTVFKYPVGSSPEFNASLICGAEWLQNPSISASQYMASAKRVLEMSDGQYSFKPFITETIGGEPFAVMEVQTASSVKQKYYAAIKKDYALFFILTYMTDEDEAVLRQALRSVRFS
jgi:hypothetical protein